MREKIWNIKEIDSEKAKDLAAKAGISEKLASLLAARGIKDEKEADAFLNCTKANLPDPFSMKGIAEAVDIIKASVANKELIGVFGDYDVDGVTATALVCEALKHLNADFLYYLPHRIEEGYGLSEEGINWAVKRGINLVITVDNGISNFNEIKKLKELGMKVIVTDHHEIPPQIPFADAVINPKQKDCLYANKDLSGVGVAFKLAQALFHGKQDIWEKWLYLPALGTLADCMDLSFENRILVKEGIGQINASPTAGIKALLSVAGFKGKADNQSVNFILAPRINAAGRLDKAELACELLLTQNETEAKDLAAKLNDLNLKRQKTEAHIQKDVEKMLMENPQLVDKNILFLFDKNWHLGVLGIVASKLVDKFGKPVFLMSAKSHYIKGSARAPEGFSPEGYNVFEMLTAASEHLMHFGGHKGAGGFSFLEENKEKVFEILDNAARSYTPCKEKLDIEMVLRLSDINLDFVKELAKLSPFGEGNSEPNFLVRGVHIQDAKLVGNPPIHLRMNIKQDNFSQKVIGFGKESFYRHIYPENFFYDIVFNLGIDNYMGVDKVNLICVDIKKPDEAAKSVIRKTLDMYDQMNKDKKNLLVDARGVKNKDNYLENILDYKDKSVVVFSNDREAYAASKNFKDAVFINNKADWDKYYSLQGAGIFTSYSFFVKFKENLKSEDVVLFKPPSDYAEFIKFLRLLDSKCRVHLLFGFGELDIMKKDLDDNFLSRQKLEKIYNIICWFNKQPSKTTKQEIFKYFEKNGIRLKDFDEAAKIFEELGICRIYAEDEIFNFEVDNTVKKSLDDSSRYRAMLDERTGALEAVKLLEEVQLLKLKNLIGGLKFKNEQLSLEGAVYERIVD